MMLSSEEMDIGPLYVNEIFNQNKIPTPSFSFGMKGYTSDESSIVDFGEPDDDRVTDVADMVTLGFNDDFFWSTSMQAISFGTNTTNSSFAIDGAPYTIFDTGSSHLMVPSVLFESIIDGIIEATGGYADYAIEQGMVFVDCAQMHLFKPLKMMFSEYYITMDP
jgi:hypothetical protein